MMMSQNMENVAPHVIKTVAKQVHTLAQVTSSTYSTSSSSTTSFTYTSTSTSTTSSTYSTSTSTNGSSII